MMIAGCMNQARNIVTLYDKILFGPPPEEQIEMAHTTMRDLLVSQEGKAFQEDVNSSDPTAIARVDLFIKRLIEAIPPIVPVALRNKSLDGGYLRTALHFMGAAELMFSRYETDIRRQANPSGVVGMCNAMHSNFELCAIVNKKLKSLDDFIMEMTSQYQTSLGLGFGFPNDATLRKRQRRNNYGRGLSYPRPGRLGGRGLNRAQHEELMVGNGGTGRGDNRQRAALRSPGVCYDFQTGACRRGNTCRFLHNN